MSKFVCHHCGESFIGSTHGNAKNEYCSENCRKRAHEDKRRAACVDCGELQGAGSGYRRTRRPALRCAECAREHMYLKHRKRDLQIEEWWNEGLPLAEIAARLGWTKNHLGVEMHRLREAGYDLPYRYTRGKRAGHRFPEQVAA